MEKVDQKLQSRMFHLALYNDYQAPAECCQAPCQAYLMGIILILFTVANMIMQEGRDA